MEVKYVGKIAEGQDGAIWGKYMFRFDTSGGCCVYDLDEIDLNKEAETLTEVSRFQLDRCDQLVPHSNAVMFGCDYYCPEDEFPLLYTNIYNNRAKEIDPMKGVCCVYRLQRNANVFSSKLIQLIEIGFTEDCSLWCSPDGSDVRPYGNFAIDREKRLYYAFTMRDGCQTTRYFSFHLPACTDGVYDPLWNVYRIKLQSSDVLGYFDCDYHHFIQGACTHAGKIYSLEGFSSKHPSALPGLRIIDPVFKMQEACYMLADYNLPLEPEFIDFRGGVCFYSDCTGALYVLSF